MLRRSAQRYPQRTAIIFGKKRVTYAQLDDLSSRIAAGIVSLKMKPGDRIALLLDNCPEFVIGYYAILKAGCIAVPVNYMFRSEEAKFILEDSGAIGIITSRAYLEFAEELRVRIDCLKHIIITNKSPVEILDFEKMARACAPLPVFCAKKMDVAVLLYTSGTMGHPKGAMLTHGNLISNARACALPIRVGHRDTFICILPLFHSFAATVCMNLPIALGARVVIMKTVKPFKRVIRAIRCNRVSILVGVPSIFNVLKNTKLPRLLRTPLIRLFNPLRVCVSGAAALPVDTFHGFQAKFKIPLLEGYGLTEASPVVSLNPLRGTHKAGSIGTPISPEINVKIVDENGMALGPEAIGELLVRGPNVMRGYYRKEEENSQVLRDGWLHTGDMVKMDADGYLYIAGRKKEMINVRGLNVYPREIEDVLYQNPAVKEAAVIGIADAHRGEIPKGFVVLKEGERVSEQELLHYLRQRLAPYKIPRAIEFREALPKNTTGKILKRLLHDKETA
jgi:long-chain acyl-CoA synthetase